MVEAGEGTITWSWDAVEGADGYAIQVSMDEMFDDMDETMYTAETSHSVEDLGYSESRFARVASTSGEGEAMLMSMWTTHMTGTTDAEPPPPPPPAPDPVSVTFTAPDGEYPMVPDKDDDEATAMAQVNTKMTVSSNATAVVTAMFVEGANGVSVAAGDNMPFSHVDWGALQADVVTDGATFMIQRTVVGANHEHEPTGDVAYVTCGPFACADGMEAPDITLDDSPVCAAWMPEAMLNVGLVDNDVFDLDGADTDPTATDGIDAGWVTDSTAAMTVKHVFSGVAKGTNYDVSGPDAAKGSDKALNLDKVKSGTASTWNDNEGYGAGIQIRLDDNVAADGTNPIGNDANPSACYADAEYGETIGQNHRPANCFRIVADGANYLGGYSITVAAKDSEVKWGSVEWDEIDDPFEDLTCDSMSFMATDSMDMSVCDMFQDEVNQALAGGWGNEDIDGNGSVSSSERGQAQVVIATSTTNAANEGNPEMWRASVRGASSDRFKTLWFDDDLDGKIRKTATDTTPGMGGPNDLYDLAEVATVAAAFQDGGDDNNLDVIWKLLRDKDNDPIMGDFGKVDLVRSTDNTATTTVDERIVPGNSDGKADNYIAADDANACTDADGGDGCDAKWSEDYEVLFTDGLFGCMAKRMVTISCEWDANGELGRYREDDHTTWVAAATTAGPSASLNLVQAETGGNRTPGWIGAFAKCTIK